MFGDLGHKGADVEPFKAITSSGARKGRLSVRATHVSLGIAAADFSRIRNRH